MKKVVSLFLSLALFFSISFSVSAGEPDLHIETYQEAVTSSTGFGGFVTRSREKWTPYENNQEISEVEFLRLAGREDLAKSAESHHSRRNAFGYGGVAAFAVGGVMAYSQLYKPADEANTGMMVVGTALYLGGLGSALYSMNMSDKYLTTSRANEVLLEYKTDTSSLIPNINLVNQEIGASFMVNF